MLSGDLSSSSSSFSASVAATSPSPSFSSTIIRSSSSSSGSSLGADGGGATTAPSSTSERKHVITFKTMTSCRDYRDPGLQLHLPCTDLGKDHTHGAWTFSMHACRKMPRGHSGLTDFLDVGRTKDWKKVAAFHSQHKDADYCSITAERPIVETSMGASGTYGLKRYTSQFIVLYLRCTGCEATDHADWVVRGEPGSGCTDEHMCPSLRSLRDSLIVDAS